MSATHNRRRELERRHARRERELTPRPRCVYCGHPARRETAPAVCSYCHDLPGRELL